MNWVNLGRTELAKLQIGSKSSNWGSLDWESSILSLSYCGLHVEVRNHLQHSTMDLRIGQNLPWVTELFPTRVKPARVYRGISCSLHRSSDRVAPGWVCFMDCRRLANNFRAIPCNSATVKLVKLVSLACNYIIPAVSIGDFEDWAFSFYPLTPQLTHLYKWAA